MKLFGNHIVSNKLARFRKQTQEMGTDSGIASAETVIPSLLFYNSHPIFFPRPLNPNVIEIGSVHVAEEKPVPKVRMKKWVSGGVGRRWKGRKCRCQIALPRGAPQFS